MKYLVAVLLTLTLAQQRVAAQSAADEYIEAKRLFNAGNYTAAQGAFSSLTGNEQYGAYASFYYALSAFKKGQSSQAISMWKQILQRYPRWDQVNEVLFWLVYASAEEQRLIDVIEYTQAIPTENILYDSAIQVREQVLKQASLDQLIAVYDQKKDNRLLGLALAQKLYRADSTVRPFLLDSLVERFSIEKTAVMDIELPNLYKDEYKVALVLPFMFESIDNPTPVIRNTLVLDVYQGIQLAKEELAAKGINIRLFIFDTKKSEKETQSFLSDLRGMDLIIGPFYPGPVKVISEFSKKEKINIINPLTENVEYMDGNPFAFLFKPSFITTAEKGAEWIIANQPKKNVLILFDQNDRDSLFAEHAKLLLEADSFNILRFQSVTDQSSKFLLDSLIEKYEEYYPKQVADSIAELDNRFIKTRRLRSEELKKGFEKYPYFYEEDDVRQERKLIAYEEKFEVPGDSIHTILAITKSNSIANNVISIVASRNDSIMLVGFGDWLEFKSLNYQQMDNLNTKFMAPGFIDKSTVSYQQTRDKFMESFRKLPSEFDLVGYELMMILGDSMDKYGKYWQKGLYDKGYIYGVLSEGVNYTNSNDNQVVPIVEIENLTLKTINKSQYANTK